MRPSIKINVHEKDLHKIPDKYRETYELHKSGKTPNEIGEIIGITGRGVGVRLRRIAALTNTNVETGSIATPKLPAPPTPVKQKFKSGVPSVLVTQPDREVEARPAPYESDKIALLDALNTLLRQARQQVNFLQNTISAIEDTL